MPPLIKQLRFPPAEAAHHSGSWGQGDEPYLGQNWLQSSHNVIKTQWAARPVWLSG